MGEVVRAKGDRDYVESNVHCDPEFQALIPPLTKDESALLEESLLAEGCREPLTVWSGIIVDGHNRYAVCGRHGLSFKTQERIFADRTQAMLWMIDNQRGRRNLADIDKIALARKKEELLRPLAKANQQQSMGRGQKGSAKLPDLKPIDSRREAAKEAGVGERTYDAGKLILDAAEKGEIEPEVINKLRQRETSIHRVAKDVKKKRQQAKRKEKRMEAVQNLTATALDNDDNCRLICCDIGMVVDQIEADSIDAIITDPPYPKEYLSLYEDLAKLAQKTLAPGGSCLVMVGQSYLPEVLQLMGKHLMYHWTIAYLTPGGQSVQLWQRKVNTFWKPVLWFVKDEYKGDWQGDVAKSKVNDNDKRFHDWGQSESGMADLIERFTNPGQIVLDPFLGGGTTGVVAVKLGRKFIGVDVDQEAIQTTRARFAEVINHEPA